jgi:hypothetical protein
VEVHLQEAAAARGAEVDRLHPAVALAEAGAGQCLGALVAAEEVRQHLAWAGAVESTFLAWAAVVGSMM